MPPAAARERAPGPFDQVGQIDRPRRDGQRAGLEAAHVEQVADQTPHVVRLILDDPEELQHLRPVELLGRAQHRGRRALDRGQGGAELVAHHAQELGPQPLELVEVREVLHGDDHRLGFAVGGADGRGVDQRPGAAAVGDRKRDLLGAQRGRVVDQAEHRDFAAVGEAADQDLDQLLRGPSGRGEVLHQSPRLPIEGGGSAGGNVEDDDSHRRRLDERLHAGARPLFVAMGAGVGDGRRRLRREQHEDVLVLVRELASAPLAGEEEAAKVRAAMAHRRPLEGLRRHEVGGEAERTDVAGQVRQPERRGEVAQVVEELRPLRQPTLHLAVLLGSEAGGDEIAGRPGVVDRGDGPVACVRESAGAVDDLL